MVISVFAAILPRGPDYEDPQRSPSQGAGSGASPLSAVSQGAGSGSLPAGERPPKPSKLPFVGSIVLGVRYAVVIFIGFAAAQVIISMFLTQRHDGWMYYTLPESSTMKCVVNL